MIRDFVFTSESVTEGHPDKLCDQISDAIVDEYLRQDPRSRVVAECALATGIVFLANRFRSRGSVDVAAVARRIIARAGYVGEDFNARSCAVMSSYNEFPAEEYGKLDEAAMDDAEIDAVAADTHVNAFGFACRQTPAFMPMPLWLAQRLVRGLDEARTSGALSGLAPDGKAQVAVAYADRRPQRLHGVTLTTALQDPSTQGKWGLREALIEEVVQPALADAPLRPDGDTDVFINPNGTFQVGGPSQHAGLTGRKNAIDTYGEFVRQSSAALSGKDPSRIDRTGAYAARYAAKNVVAAGLAEECEVQLSYAPGRARPISINVETYATGTVGEAEIARRLAAAMDFRPAAIVRDLRLRLLPQASGDGFYERLAVYGHMGRDDMTVPWEALDLAERLFG